MAIRDLATESLGTSPATWGISGPHFLALYIPLVVVVGVPSALFVRSRALRLQRSPKAAGLSLDEAAMLSGGDRLTVTVALTELRCSGLIDEGCLVIGLTKPGPDVSSVARAVHTTLTAGSRRSGRRRDPVPSVADLARRPAVAAALDAVRVELQNDGLLTVTRPADALLVARLPFLGVVAFGVARIVAGIGNNRSVGFLVVVVAVAVGFFVAVLCASSRPRPTRAGSLTLRHLRTENQHLAPHLSPSWTTYGGEAVVLSAALFGGLAVFSADPAFAESIGARWVTATSSSSANSYSGGSSCSSSNSGGGSGCGGSSCGGGGGCGGGGCGG